MVATGKGATIGVLFKNAEASRRCSLRMITRPTAGEEPRNLKPQRCLPASATKRAVIGR
jgi:hypothetical protein